MQEVRERMGESPFWFTSHRKAKKLIHNGSIIFTELLQQAWVVYGSCIYWSEDSEGCDTNYKWVMLMYLVIGYLKMICFLGIVLLVLVWFIMGKLQKNRRRDLSLGIIRGIASVKFSALMNQGESDEECSICFEAYANEDLVSKLECNSRHIFHKECLAAWVRTGKNSCPTCRAPINQ